MLRDKDKLNNISITGGNSNYPDHAIVDMNVRAMAHLFCWLWRLNL